MKKQQLQELSIEQLQGYRSSLLSRNNQLRSMIHTCQNQAQFLQQRIQYLTKIKKQQQQSKDGIGSKLQTTPIKQNSQTEKKYAGLTSFVSGYTLSAINKVRQGTSFLGKNLVQTSSKIGGSILSFGQSIKNKITGQNVNLHNNNINPLYLIPNTPPQQIISVPHIQKSQLYQKIIQSQATSTVINQQHIQHSIPVLQSAQQKLVSNETDNTKAPSSKSSKQESKSIIDKLEAVVSGQI